MRSDRSRLVEARFGRGATELLPRRRPLGTKALQVSKVTRWRSATISSTGRLCLTKELRDANPQRLYGWVVGSSIWLALQEAPWDATEVRVHRTDRGSVEAIFTGPSARKLLSDARIRSDKARAKAALVLIEISDGRPDSLLLKISRAEVVRAWE